MARMVRKQILLDDDLEAEVERRAAEAGISQGELIRRTLRGALQSVSDERRSEAHERLMAMVREWQASAPPLESGAEPPADRGWTREELYEDDEGFPRGIGNDHPLRHEHRRLHGGHQGAAED